MGDRHGLCQVADRANRGLGVDHLQQPALLQRFAVIQLRRQRLEAASLEPYRVVVYLIDNVIGGLGKRLLGVFRYNQEPEAAGKTEAVRRPVCLP